MNPRVVSELNNKNLTFCDCGGRIVFDGRELFCERCGLVHGTTFDFPPKMAGHYLLQREELPGMGLGSSVPSSSSSSSFPRGEITSRLSMTHRVYGTGGDCAAMKELARISSALSLPESVRATAARIHRKAVRGGILSRKPLEVAVAASVLAACRVHRIYRTVEEVADAAGADKHTILRLTKKLTSALRVRRPTAEEYLEAVAAILLFSAEERTRAEAFLERLRDAENRGRNPRVIAAAIAYAAARGRVTQREVAEALKVDESSFRKLARLLIEEEQRERLNRGRNRDGSRDDGRNAATASASAASAASTTEASEATEATETEATESVRVRIRVGTPGELRRRGQGA